MKRESPVVLDTPTSWRADVRAVASWVTLGAAAGGIGGLLVGGIGGRLAMLLLRFTSDHSIRGLESDDGFTMGRFDLTSTLNLLIVTTVLGSIVGLIVVAGRPFFPKAGMPFAWAAAGALTGGALLIHGDGVDFTRLEPHWLAVALFVAVPALGAGLIAALVELLRPYWTKNRPLTAAASLALVPSIVALPVAVAALIVGAAWFLAMQFPAVRALPSWAPARAAAVSVFGIVVALGVYDLQRDVRDIL